MELKGAANMEFELKVVGYQFPHLQHEPYDSDWLKINIRVKHPRGSWSSTDPCLLTYELASLIEWLESIVNDEPVDSEIDFIEPNLHFALLTDGTKKLRVYFELECRPSWAPADEAGLDDLWVEFEVTPESLKSAAENLRLQLQRFPVRAGVRSRR